MAASMSSHQREILVLWLVGYTYDEIGARMHISERTVDNTLLMIKQQLAMFHRAQLFHYAWDKGWLSTYMEGYCGKRQ